MERLARSHHRTFRRLFYTRAALKEIYAVLADGADEVQCTVGDYRVDAVDELDRVDLANVSDIAFYNLTGKTFGAIRLFISPYGADLKVADDRDTHVMGQAALIERVLSRLKKSKLRLIRVLAGVVVGALAIFLSSTAVRAFPPWSGAGIVVAFVVTGAVIGLGFLLLTRWEPRTIRFTDMPRGDTFWSRKKDDILLAVGSLVSGAVVTNLDRMWSLLQKLWAVLH